MKSRILATLAAALLAAAGCRSSGPLAAEPPADEAVAQSESVERPDPTDPIPDVEMTTQSNERVRFYSDCVRGKTVLVNVMYTRCNGSCPGNTANLVKVQELLGDRVGKDVFFVSISLDPENDGPAELRSYAEAHGVKPGWRFLTGSKADVERLRRRLGFWDPDPAVDRDKSQHAGLVVFGNDRRGWWAALPAMSNPERIAAAVTRIAGAPESGDGSAAASSR
jgi:protein SCO1